MTILKKFNEIERGLIVGEVTIDGDTGEILTTGPLTVNNSIDINGEITLADSGDVDINGYLKVLSEKTTLHSLDVNNAVLLSSTLAVQQDATFSQDITISGGDLKTTNTTFNLLNTVVETINFGGNATTINIGKTGNHSVIAKSNLQVTNILSVGDELTITNGKFVFDGAEGTQGATTLLGTLDVGQAVDLSATLNVVGVTDLRSVTNIYDDLYIKTGTTTKFSVDNANGNTIIHGTQNTKGAVDLDSTLNVDGTTTLNAATTINSTLHTTGAVDFDNNLNVDGTLNVEGASVIDDTLQVTGNLNADIKVITPLVETPDVQLPNARLNGKTLTLGSWTIVHEAVSNKLVFKYDNTTVMSLTTAGVLTTNDDITAHGTV
jgi:cytoskeletal protein CcmA (bactofilin family)